MCKQCEEYLATIDQQKTIDVIEKHADELIALFVKIDQEANADVYAEAPKDVKEHKEACAMVFAAYVLGYMQSRHNCNVFAVDLMQTGAMVSQAKKCVDRSRVKH